ncbi:MAG: NAD(P)/FAD-dependent oxidoreductase [Chitinophagales bacterium]|nr:NAD(P)/FAD-dependent oxidoreductase [Chitinophagales bacterium]
MDENTFDVIVIGGGLAGLSSAIQLAVVGRKVLLLEKNKYPFHRVCGEYISMESWDYLQRIGVPLSSMKLPQIRTLCISSVHGKTVEQDLGAGGFGISRYTLDNTMAAIAKRCGVHIMEECKAEAIEMNGEEFNVRVNKKFFSARLVIGAFGKRSNLDKELNRKVNPEKVNWVGVKYHVKADVPDNRIELHNFNGGYCGISKVDNGNHCLCYLTRSENLKQCDGDIRRMEENILSINPFLKIYFSNREHFLFKEPVTISQINLGKKRAVENHVLMMGDAAGMIAPLCGNGMSMALHSAEMSFIIIENFLAGNISRAEMEQEYLSRWKLLFAGRLKTGRLLQPVLVKPALTNPAIGLLNKFPSLLSLIIKFTHGKPF